MAKPRTRKRFADYAREERMLVKTHYTRTLKRMIINHFEWQNLPTEIPQEFIENELYNKGYVIYHEEFGFPQFSAGTIVGLNLYNEPTAVTITDVTGMCRTITDRDKFVVVYNDNLRTDSASDVNYFANNLQEIRRTFNLNLKQLKTPVITACDESQLESVKDFYGKVDDGVPFIAVTKDFISSTNFEVLDLKATSHIRELAEAEATEWANALTFFGVNNVNIMKKERLITDEAESNNELIQNSAEIYLTARLRACDEIREKFGRDFNVKIKGSEEDIPEERGLENENDNNLRIDEE